MHKFEKLLSKKLKDGKTMSDTEKQAKGSVLNEMKSMASDMIGDKIKGLKKVSVASNSEEGIKHGLDKARELIGGQDESDSEDEESMEDPQEEISESPEAESDEQKIEDMCKDMDESQIDDLIKKLMEIKDNKREQV